MRRATLGLRFLAVLALTTAALGTGCNTGPRPPAAVGNDPISGNYPKITIDGGLRQYFVAEYASIVVRQPSADRPLSVQVPGRSQADNEFIIQYNFTWFDAEGGKVGESGWRTENVPSRRQVMLSANAMMRSAVDWRLDVRSAR